MLISGVIRNGSGKKGQCLLNENGFKYWKSDIKVLRESFKYISFHTPRALYFVTATTGLIEYLQE